VTERRARERVDQTLCGPLGLLPSGIGQEDRELVAAVPGRDVRSAERSPDQVGGPAEDLVTEEMAERVVDELEVVEDRA
jgi:hypothetical protein